MQPADIVDLRRRSLLLVQGAKNAARDLAALPNPRDRAAAVEATVGDYRRIIRKRHGVTGSEADGLCTACRHLLTAEINRIRSTSWPPTRKA